MSKKIIAAVLCVCLAAFQLTGCGNDISETTDLSRTDHNSSATDSMGDSSQDDNSASQASLNEYTVSVNVGEEYTADKLCSLVVSSEGAEYSFDDGTQTKKFEKPESSIINVTAVDGTGNKTHIVIKVIAADRTPPVFEGVKDMVVDHGAPVDLKSGITVKDNCDKNLTFTVTYDEDDYDPTAVGIHHLTYTAKDSAGNVGTAKATIEVKATTKQTTKQTSKQTSATQQPTPSVTQGTTKAAQSSSPNVKIYQDRIHVAGDSIAYGFCAYGYIPVQHNIAQGSLAMRNYTSYGSFTVNGQQMRCMDAIATLKPRLLYVSMGMNDINMTDAQTYANNYVGFLRQVRSKVPNCIIIAANITPTEARRTDFSVNKIRNCNAAMTAAVSAMNDSNIILFDAYSVVSAGGTYMASGYGAGDGLHLAGHVYQKLLNSLAIVLDQHGVKERLQSNR